MPGITNSPVRFSSFSASAASSSKNSRDCVRLISKRSAKCEKSSDLPIFRASSIVSPKVRKLGKRAVSYYRPLGLSIRPEKRTSCFCHLIDRLVAYGHYDARDLSQPASRARIRNRDRLPRVHVDVPEDGTARLRYHPYPLRARCALHRAQVSQILPVGIPQQGNFL